MLAGKTCFWHSWQGNSLMQNLYRAVLQSFSKFLLTTILTTVRYVRTHCLKDVVTHMQPRQPLNVVRLRTQMCPQYTLGVFKCVLRAVHLWLDHSGSLIPSLSNAVTPLRSNCICKTESSFFNNLTFRREGIILRVPALSLMHHISHSYEMFPL